VFKERDGIDAAHCGGGMPSTEYSDSWRFNTSGPSPLPESAKTPAQIAAWYEQSTADTLGQLSKLTPEQLTKIVTFAELMQMPAVMYLQFALHHSIHHRGQLSAYLRAMGGKVPAIYGESFDSAAEEGAGAEDADAPKSGCILAWKNFEDQQRLSARRI